MMDLEPYSLEFLALCGRNELKLFSNDTLRLEGKTWNLLPMKQGQPNYQALENKAKNVMDAIDLNGSILVNYTRLLGKTHRNKYSRLVMQDVPGGGKPHAVSHALPDDRKPDRPPFWVMNRDRNIYFIIGNVKDEFVSAGNSMTKIDGFRHFLNKRTMHLDTLAFLLATNLYVMNQGKIQCNPIAWNRLDLWRADPEEYER